MIRLIIPADNCNDKDRITSSQTNINVIRDINTVETTIIDLIKLTLNKSVSNGKPAVL
jgi:hypothetical protein